MEPRISIITLGVSDLKRSIDFYRAGLELLTNYKDSEGIAFFQLSGTWLALYPSNALAEDACLPPERTAFGGFTLAHNVKSKELVDKIIDQALGSEATLLKPALIPSGVDIPAIFPTRMATHGKWPGIHFFRWSKS